MTTTTLGALASVLDALGVRWVLIGALAANRYRSAPRLTLDADLLLADFGPGLDTMEAALREAGWSVVRADPSAELLRLRHPRWGIADLLVAGTAYQREALERARIEQLDDGVEVRVLTVEDVIVHKLIASRFQDLADIEAVLASNPQLDEAYIERWAEFWGMTATWRQLRTPGG